MAQIIQFPGTTNALAQHAAVVAAALSKPEAMSDFPVVRALRKDRRVPKRNREEDQETIMFARIAKSWSNEAHALAQTAPNSEQHRLMLHMAGIAKRLPRNNLRIFTTPEDVIQGIWWRWRCVLLANTEWELCDHRRFHASYRGDEDERAYWSTERDKADEKRWYEYERLVRIPATRLSDVTSYKLYRGFGCGMGSIEWMRTHKPELAAIIDDEAARLNAEKDARKASRGAKKGRFNDCSLHPPQ